MAARERRAFEAGYYLAVHNECGSSPIDWAGLDRREEWQKPTYCGEENDYEHVDGYEHWLSWKKKQAEPSEETREETKINQQEKTDK